jgi:N-acetylglucosamine-6-sulfatase
VIETDDQTLEETRVMRNVQRLIGDAGATFANSFVNFSLCCPSRATFMTGKYMHNHGVQGNLFPTGGFARFEALHGDDNLAVWLQRAGYHTGMVGKYLNEYTGTPPVPPGWSEWYATSGRSQFVYDYSLDENGTTVDYGTRPTDFKQDVLTGKAVGFLDRAASAGEPFFLWLTYTAPHVGAPDPSPQPPSTCSHAAKPAPRHAHAFDSEPLPMTPNFNEADVSDKPAAVRKRPPLPSNAIANIQRRYRCELKSLLSVDDGVQRVIQTLRASGELSNTYVIFTSDNGFFHGEHRVPTGKTRIYEESIRVPLLMRGPGIPRGVEVRDLAINADLAPTIVAATGANPGVQMDGQSLLPAAEHPGVERGRELLVEQRNFQAIRTQRYIYVRYDSGERELYNLHEDPYELRDRSNAGGLADVRRRLSSRLVDLQGCKGNTCRTKPHVRLRLRFRSGLDRGRRCVRGPLRARLGGPNRGGVAKVEYYVRGKLAASSSSLPFKRRLSLKRFHHRRKTRLRARVRMIDGRQLTVERHVRACR